MNMLKVAAPTLSGGDNSSLLGKRRLDQVQGFESEAQIKASLMHGNNGSVGQGADLSRLLG